MQVIGTENNEIPVVTLQISLKGGRMVEANDQSKSGARKPLYRHDGRGHKNYTSEQLSVELEKLGSTISIYTTEDATVFAVQSLKKNLAKTLQLLEERMFRPRFTEEDFNRNKNQVLELIRTSKSQPSVVASQVYNKINFGNSIWSIPVTGTMETVKNITLDDVRQDLYKYILQLMDV